MNLTDIPLNSMPAGWLTMGSGKQGGVSQQETLDHINPWIVHRFSAKLWARKDGPEFIGREKWS